jgi:uncharacterized lipoprotein YddW (UPF0748 family)
MKNMKFFTIILIIPIIAAFFLTSCTTSIPPEFRRTQNQEEEKREIIGVWISYIELSGILTRKTKEQFRKSYAEMMDNCLSLGINTVYVHLRPFGDALYSSDYYPWSKYITGTVGREPDFDPLQVMLEETHSRGIEFHGWINPMRIHSEHDIEKVSKDYLIGQWYNDDSKRGRYIIFHRNNWTLNPAYPEVIELIADGVREITEKYAVDGIHIDDRFYPTAETSFDAEAFSESSFSSLTSFRRFNCNNMVSAMYSAAKCGNPNAVFSISPQADIDKNLNEFYADVITWTSHTGFADYIIPQIYYGFNHDSLPFTETAERWQELAKHSEIPLIFGLAVYKIGSEDIEAGAGHREWIEEREILRRQIEKARKLPNYGGIVFFSYSWLFNPTHATILIKDELNAIKPIIAP